MCSRRCTILYISCSNGRLIIFSVKCIYCYQCRKCTYPKFSRVNANMYFCCCPAPSPPPPVWCGKIRESDSGLPYSHFRGEREGEGGDGRETGTRHGKVAKIKIPFFSTNPNESVITSRVSSLNRLKRNGGFIIDGMGPTG